MDTPSGYSPAKLWVVTLVSVVALCLTYSTTALGEEPVVDTPPTTPPPATTVEAALLSSAVFKESDQSNVRLNSLFDDGSTNIAFYIACPSVACPDNGTPDSPVYIFSAENLGQGIKPFSDYWAPPTVGDYIAIEYSNDHQQFTCSDKTVSQCESDTHFISSYEFALVSDATEITPQLLASKNKDRQTEVVATTTVSGLTELSINLSASFITSDLENGQIVTAILDGKSSASGDLTMEGTSTSDALKELSIDLSAPSITANLEDGQIVTAILDNKTTTASGTQSDEATSSQSVGDFILGIVDSIINIFTPNSPPTQAPDHSDAPATNEESNAPATPEPVNDTTPHDTPPAEPQ